MVCGQVWGIFLIHGWCGWAQASLGNASSGLVVMGCIRKRPSKPVEGASGKQHFSTASASAPASGLLPWLSSVEFICPRNFPPRAAFVVIFLTRKVMSLYYFHSDYKVGSSVLWFIINILFYFCFCTSPLSSILLVHFINFFQTF